MNPEVVYFCCKSKKNVRATFNFYRLIYFAERKPIIACTNITMATKFNGSLANAQNYNVTRYEVAMKQYITQICKSYQVTVETLEHRYSNDSLEIVNKLEPPANAVDIAGILSTCVSALKADLGNQSSILSLANDASNAFDRDAIGVSMETTQCCTDTKQYCCPTGHRLHDVHQGAHVCCKNAFLFVLLLYLYTGSTAICTSLSKGI